MKNSPDMSLNKYIAHSKNHSNKYQYLIQHLTKVSEHAEIFLDGTILNSFSHVAAILHDIGKIHPDFQDKLRSESGIRVDHKGLGVAFAKKLTKSEFVCKVIAAHHGGLVNNASFLNWWKEVLESGKIFQVKEEATEIIKLFELPGEDFTELEEKLPIQKDLAMRMVLSALADADFLDTEEHFNGDISKKRKPKTLSVIHREYFTDYHKKLTQKKTGELNKLRSDVFNSCLEKAKNKPGFFRLTVPTGGGKTLSSLGFAIQHALNNDQKRIIYAIPFTSIIEQTAEEFKRIFPHETVVEHHSGIHFKDSEEYDKNDVWNRLASENWDAPIIITTTVQLFESLLARTTSKCRKLHNILNSVIILDEVQTLPLHLVPTIMSVLRDLVTYFNVSVVFCTATQPALDEFLKNEGGQLLELSTQPEKLFRKLKRVDYHNHSNEKWSWDQVAEEMKSSERVMCVVNTKKDAHVLWRTINNEAVYHLSSAMCGAHRKDILSEIKEKLIRKDECKLVATQVVEAGVDLDFDKVLRAIAPLERIVQAAGRCNREGKLNRGEVIIFNPENGHFPRGEYGSALHSASQLLNNPDIEVDLNNPGTFPEYFKQRYKNIQLDPKGIEENRRKLKFEYVARDFKMIDDNSITVIVNYKSEIVGELLEKLKSMPQLARPIFHELQPFMVSLPSWEFNKNRHLVNEVFHDLYLWTGKYDSKLGLLKEFNLTNFVT